MSSLDLSRRPSRPAGLDRLVAVLLTSVAMSLAFGALSPGTGTGLIDRVAPQSAEAFQGGWDRDHWWIKVTRAEVFQGVVVVACGRFVPWPYSMRVCGPIGQTAKHAIRGGRGLWAEVYPPRWVWLRRGIGWWTPTRYRVGIW
ncbi:MAG TPA: hypothetical protein VHF88_10730 [Thermoleophilaceae bacterium]|nr:hypothetical protein [Thermoleophilaceae bacterium]